MNDSPYKRIESKLRRHNGAIVAYSGGVDSTLLAVLAHRAYGGSMLAVFAHSPFVSLPAQNQARAVAAEAGFPFVEIEHPGFDGFASPNAPNTSINSPLMENPENRCYLCKQSLLRKLHTIAEEHGFDTVMHGENMDDLGEDRPGARAAQELGVVAPFVEAEISKEDIRALARELELPNADTPSDSCLATRVPFNTSLTQELLDEVAWAEEKARLSFPHATRIRARIRG